MSVQSLMDRSRVLHEALEQIGWSDADAVVQRVQRLDIGLPAEDEFAVICSWLGKCSLIHKLDQQQTPKSSRENYQVPDLLAVFDTGHNQYKVLIEVKTKNERYLTIRAKDRDKLIKYGELLGMPVLFAWKYHEVWMLFDISLFKLFNKNYRVFWFEALSNSLMSVLAGDVGFQLGDGVGLHLTLSKEKLHREDGDTQAWNTRIKEIYFQNYLGEKIYHMTSSTLAIIGCCELEDSCIVDDESIKQTFLVRSGMGYYAHKSLASLLKFRGPSAQDSIHWRSLLVDETPLYSSANFQKALDEALHQKIVRLIIIQHPVIYPSFIQENDRSPHASQLPT